MPSSAAVAPFLLEPWFSPRPWGTLDLSPWYALKPTEPIGEAWLTGEACLVSDGPFAGQKFAGVVAENRESILGKLTGAFQDYPLLLKILFPHEKLSVQVHPDDALAVASGQTRGKTECWYVLSAEPGAAVALGLKPGTDAAKIRAAVADHTMEDLMVQVPVVPGDMVFVDAGTVHAIGPGVILLETQQTSDLTYRLYDYGRPRELHVEKAIEATRLQTAAGKIAPVEKSNRTILIEQHYFSVDRLQPGPDRPLHMDGTGTPHTVVLTQGSAELTTNDGSFLECRKGQAVIIPASVTKYTVQSAAGATLVRSVPPAVI
jgi:mannose-6-phosphate isomerase